MTSIVFNKLLPVPVLCSKHAIPHNEISELIFSFLISNLVLGLTPCLLLWLLILEVLDSHLAKVLCKALIW